MDDEFNIKKYLDSHNVSVPRRNHTAFLAMKEQIYEASKDYSMKQIWIALRDNGKYSGTYPSFVYYFRRYRSKKDEDEAHCKSVEEYFEKEKKKPEKDSKKDNKKSGFDIPTDPEEKL